MALAKIKKHLAKIIIGGLIVSNLASITFYLKERDVHINTSNSNTAKIAELTNKANELEQENEKLLSIVDYNINSSSTIGAVREGLVKHIQDSVSKRGEELNNPGLSIDELDAMRALKSAENRVIDEYIRITALVLAAMNTESNFTHKVSQNKNGTSDYGIMQVNEVSQVYISNVLGEDVDFISNKTDNVESGSLIIYDCYLQAKEKHPEDVIWWTYAYYNRGLYFENTESWKDKSHPDYEAVHKQADTRSKIFKETYEYYYNDLKEALDN